jgi:hypothetical protein
MLQEKKQLEEGIFDTIADIGITAGQMVGGTVGQAAGLAGCAKYGKDLIGVIDKPFLEMVGPLLGFFFSIQALVFPMPAVGTIRGILAGFFKGVGGVIKGTGGLLAKGVMLVIRKGAGFISKAIGILAKALKGVMGKVSSGGPIIQKITAKLPTFGKAVKGLEKGMTSLSTRLDILANGLKILGKQGGKAKQLAVGAKSEMYTIKSLLKKAFQTGGDDLAKVSSTVKAGLKDPKKAAGMFSKAKDATKGLKGVAAAKAGSKALAKEIARIPSKLKASFEAMKQSVGKSGTKFIASYLAGPNGAKLLEPLIGQTVKAAAGHSYKLVGSKGGQILFQTTKGLKAGADVSKATVKSVSAAKFFTSYGRQFLNPKIFPQAKSFHHFLRFLGFAYPKHRLGADVARIYAASGKDAEIVPGTYGDVEMPD